MGSNALRPICKCFKIGMLTRLRACLFLIVPDSTPFHLSCSTNMNRNASFSEISLKNSEFLLFIFP